MIFGGITIIEPRRTLLDTNIMCLLGTLFISLANERNVGVFIPFRYIERSVNHYGASK